MTGTNDDKQPLIQPTQRQYDWPLLAMMTVIIILLGYAATQLWLTHQHVVNVVVFDSERFFTAKASQDAKASVSNPTSMPTDAKVFVDAVRAEIVVYRSKGYIVLNSAQVVAWPEATDITPELAKKMGVALGE
ncbi:MAG: hypothetical protein Q7U16_14975 [Agitococcus sp.]|nr:hypothetical protein [Agitococcus sp.]